MDRKALLLALGFFVMIGALLIVVQMQRGNAREQRIENCVKTLGEPARARCEALAQ